MPSPVKYHAGAFPPSTLRWEDLIPLIGPASAAVARYDGILGAIPNPDVLLSPLTTQEAVLSSRIEGTQATMGEVLEFEADASRVDVPEARREDILEILNYRKGMRLAEEMLATLPLSLRVIKQVHSQLLEGVRGQGKAPGEFRRVPNWIGPAGCTMEEARFVPVDAGALPDAMTAWERYLHVKASDRLVQLAIAHAEFEALHPFLDGNGRLGRIVIPLFLWQHQLIRRPMFYVSAYFEAHRDVYYEKLLAVSRDGDWTGWCQFFLEAVRIQAEENQAKAEGIIKLYEELKLTIHQVTRSRYAIQAQDWLFARPIFKSTDFVAGAKIPDASARKILPLLKENHIIREVTAGAGRRATIFIFPRLLNIAEGKEAF